MNVITPRLNVIAQDGALNVESYAYVRKDELQVRFYRTSSITYEPSSEVVPRRRGSRSRSIGICSARPRRDGTFEPSLSPSRMGQEWDRNGTGMGGAESLKP